jgi:phosphatidylcholine synthase
MRGKIRAWMVHAYTALGVVTGFFALRAFLDGSPRQAFMWLAGATIIDSTDGPLARFFRTSEVLPQFNGRRLDDIVDYLNFVVIPAVILVLGGLLPGREWVWGCIPALASAYGFCREDAKTEDGFFMGFPSYWNIVAFYLYILRLPRSVNLLIVLALSGLVFVPIKYIDPFKTRPLRPLTAPLTIAWGMAILSLIATMKNPSPFLLRASLLYCAYYLIASLWIHVRCTKPYCG